MEEQFPSPEVQESVAVIVAHGLREWLKKEVGNSTTGRNHYLDDFNQFRDDLARPYNAERNDNAQKNRSHYNRLIEWTGQFSNFYDYLDISQQDSIVARQIFCAQMYLSGLFRVQCLMQASEQEDYYQRRLDRAFIGIDLEAAILDRMNDPTPLTLDELAKKTLSQNQAQQHHVKKMHDVGLRDIGKDESLTVDRITELQEGWAGLITDYAMFTADQHGGNLSSVPFLEPKSISDDPQVYYPFAGLAFDAL